MICKTCKVSDRIKEANMKNITQDCVDIVKDLAGHEYLYFDTALEVRTSPHTFPFQAWGVCASPQDELYVMDGNQEWHKIEPNVGNAYLVLGSLYQRLQLLRRKYPQRLKGSSSVA
jgi:hypothetical protein